MKTNLLRNSKLTWLFFASLVVLASCSKDDDNNPAEPQIESTTGVYVLSEGYFNQGNGSIAYFDLKTNTSEKNYYKKVNGTDLGETPNDLKRYGSKMYCVVSGTASSTQSFIDVMDVKTCKSIKRIPFNSATGGYVPRYITFFKNKAYVSRYDGKISRIDTASLSVDAELNLEVQYLEGLDVANGKLYVANSDYFATGKVDKVTVIDLATFKKTKDITVSINPAKVTAAPNGDIYVIGYGNYVTQTPGTLDKISSVTDAKVQTTAGYGYGSGLTFTGTKGYISTETAVIKQFNFATGTAGDNFITDGSSFSYLYGITVDPFSGILVTGDAVNTTSGKAYIYNSAGVKKQSFDTGVNPQSAVFVYSYKK